MVVHTILYVKNQIRSRDFYSNLLALSPRLDVPGMTEFELSEQHILGLMPETGIKKLLGDTIPDPTDSNGVSRAELYLHVSDPELLLSTAVELGAKQLSPVKLRDWGDRVGYVMDFDGHVLAFAGDQCQR